MTRIVVYRGPAGTGKTHNLIERLKAEIENREFKETEEVLALTFMHGSRKRLDGKLREISKSHNVRYKCLTIDSFAVGLVNRFRSYLGINEKMTVNSDPAFDVEYKIHEEELAVPLERMQQHVIALLRNSSVIKYIANSYPIVLIDEFQDCHGPLFQIISLLKPKLLLIAIDPFQQLLKEEYSDSNVWIDNAGADINELSNSWRTKVTALLSTAAALRDGQINSAKKVYSAACTAAKNVASSSVTRSIYFALSNKSKSIAIIAPTLSCKFVQAALNGLNKSYKYKEDSIGPYQSLIGRIETTSIEELANGYLDRALTKDDLLPLIKSEQFVLKRSAESALRKLKLRNLEEISSDEFRLVLQQSAHVMDNFVRRDHHSKVIVTTIHGAKNREFDNVIILWPYEVSGNEFYKRKLLYNAVTRARKSATILIQHENMKTEELRTKPLFRLLFN